MQIKILYMTKLKKWALSLSLLIMGGMTPTKADVLTLDGCLEKAHDNYPVIKQYALVEKSRDLNVSNAAKAWLPGISVNGFAVGYTDILDFSSLNESIGKMTGSSIGMDNYIAGGALMINQVVYDGGAISAKKNIAKAQSEVEQKKLDVSMYDVNSRVEQLYFGTLMLDEQIRQNELLQSDLGISEKSVQSLVSGGMANQSDLDAVSVRLVQAQQQEINLKSMRKTYLSMLGYFIGSPDLGTSVVLEKPAPLAVQGNSDSSLLTLRSSLNNRPELSLYSSQQQLLDVQKKALNARLMPTVGAFALGTAHTRPLGMINSTAVAGGLTVKWNIGALYTRKNDLAGLENQRSQIETQRETFLFNNNMQTRQTDGQIENILKQMQLDDKAVTLRQGIRDKAEKKVKNGTETVNELLRDINAVSEAKQQKAIHEIQLLQAEYNLKLIKNN